MFEAAVVGDQYVWQSKFSEVQWISTAITLDITYVTAPRSYSRNHPLKKIYTFKILGLNFLDLVF